MILPLCCWRCARGCVLVGSGLPILPAGAKRRGSSHLTSLARCRSRPDAAALAAAAAALSGTTASQLTALSAALAADPQARASLGSMPLLAGVQNEQAPLQQLQQLHAALLSLGQVHAQLMAQQVAGDPGGEGAGTVKAGGVGGAGGGSGEGGGGTSGATPDPREEAEAEAAEAEGKAGGGEASKSRRSYRCSVCGQPKRWERVCLGDRAARGRSPCSVASRPPVEACRGETDAPCCSGHACPGEPLSGLQAPSGQRGAPLPPPPPPQAQVHNAGSPAAASAGSVDEEEEEEGEGEGKREE
jgi:hypothetical protein